MGTDCVVGKKFTALSIAKEMKDRGLKADFRATGQTGIMIAGGGIPIDAVVADFVSGAAEVLTPDNDVDHWDIIEGQGFALSSGLCRSNTWVAARLLNLTLSLCVMQPDEKR